MSREIEKVRALANAPKNYAHMCGSFGCESVEYLPGQDQYVREQRMAWAGAHQKEHGEFPDSDAQIQFIIDATDRYRTEVWPVIQRRAALVIARDGGAQP